MRVIDTERVPIKMWLNYIEEGALQQAKNIANLPFVYKWVAIMPDSHQGYGMPIGGVAALEGVICPNMVGVDIGCGMGVIRTNVPVQSFSKDSARRILGAIRKRIPVGFDHHKHAQEWEGFDRAPEIGVIQHELDSARNQLGTLGGGNHFIELQSGSDGFLWAMLHSGSRNFGLQVAKVYHERAKNLCKQWHVQLPDAELAYLPFASDDGQEYYQAMSYCLDFAQANRDHMMNVVEEILADELCGMVEDRVNIHHNYAAMENHYGKNVMVHRKGATCVRHGIRGIIPGSMGTSSYIVDGLGNAESFNSCSHGAGRRMGRKQATIKLNLQEEQEMMDSMGIIHGMRNISDLDEAPGAYKDIDEVMRNQRDLVRITTSLRPLASIKA